MQPAIARPAAFEKDVIEHNIHDHRTEQGEAERNETRADKQEQTAHDLEQCDGINISAADERSDERAGLAFQWRHRNEVQESVGPEDGEHEPEQDANDVDGVFHRFIY